MTTHDHQNTRCSAHQSNQNSLYCTVCGRPFSWPAGTTPKTYAELAAENKALWKALEIVEAMWKPSKEAKNL